MDITFTGVDEYTDLDKLAGLPHVEIGVLVSATPEGRIRYPSEDWITNSIPKLKRHCALHICGKGARAKLLEGYYRKWTDGLTRRIQVNGVVSPTELSKICALYPTQEVITQYSHPENNRLSTDDGWGYIQENQHSILVDASGGRGIVPRTWAAPFTKKRVGFAGGLNTNNIIDNILKIAVIAGQNSWIDMESGLRDEHDKFSIDKVFEIMNKLDEFRKSIAQLDSLSRLNWLCS